MVIEYFILYLITNVVCELINMNIIWRRCQWLLVYGYNLQIAC